MSRWHGITDDTTVGGDVGTVTATSTTASTTSRAAHCYDVSGDGAGGA